MRIFDVPEIVLIRGVPGSDKTTKAKTEYADHKLVEADMFFEDDGTYKYDHRKIKDAHKWCQDTVEQWLEMGYDVVVANTFTRVWEMQPYLDMGYPVKIVEATGNYGNVHGVPPEIVRRMRERFEVYSC